MNYGFELMSEIIPLCIVAVLGIDMKKGGEKEHNNGCPDCFLANFFNEMRRRMDIDPHSSQPKEGNTVGKKICSKLP